MFNFFSKFRIRAAVGIISAGLLIMTYQNCGEQRLTGKFSQPSTGQSSQLASLTLAWDPNPEPELAGYMVRYGTSAGSRTLSIDAGSPSVSGGAVNFTVPNLVRGQTYYFVVTAYDSGRTESPVSNEVSRLVQ